MGRVGQMAMALVLAAVPAGGAVAQDRPGAVLDLGRGAELVIVTPLPLGPEEFAAVREFMGQSAYFGAIAVDPGPGDVFYWVTGYQSQALAMEVAYTGCKGFAAPGADCVLHARIDPAGYLPRLGRPVELGAPAGASWRGFYLGGQKPGRFAAFALSGMSSGAAVDSDTVAEAESSALVECEEAAAGAMKALSAPARDAVRRGGQHLCRVVDSRGP